MTIGQAVVLIIVT